MSKFSKFLTFTAILGAATATGIALYKKYQDNKEFIDDDFDDFDDFDDDLGDLEDTERGYTSISNDTVSAEDADEDDDDDDLSDSLTEEEREALSAEIETDSEDGEE